MEIIKIIPFENGGHDNQSWNGDTVPDGWAQIPDDMEIPETYPFVNITVEDVDGIPTVTEMTAGVVPEPEPMPEPEPTSDDILNALLGVTV